MPAWWRHPEIQNDYVVALSVLTGLVEARGRSASGDGFLFILPGGVAGTLFSGWW